MPVNLRDRPGQIAEPRPRHGALDRNVPETRLERTDDRALARVGRGERRVSTFGGERDPAAAGRLDEARDAEAVPGPRIAIGAPAITVPPPIWCISLSPRRGPGR